VTKGQLDERGVTLLELLVAITIFTLVMAGVAASVGSGLDLSRTNRHRSVAANLASEEMDVVRSSNFMTLAPRTVVRTIDDIDYDVRRDLTWVSKSATNGPCDGSGGTPQVLRVQVTVRWPDMGGVAPVRTDTVLTPPVGAFDPNSGHIAVKVLDRDAQPQDAAIVTINGPTNETLPTNAQGCAFFAFLPAGTYDVHLGTAGYVDRQSNPMPAQTLGVSVGNISSVQFDYDEAATVEATLVPSDGGTVPDDLALVLANAQYLPNGTRTVPGTGPVRTVADLFPALEGYALWAGECADADPEGLEVVGGVTFGPYWPGATRSQGVAPAGGSTATADVVLPSAVLTVTDPVGTPIAGATVVASHEPDNVCATGVQHTLGATDAAGQLAVALPYGHWTVSVDGFTASAGDWPELVLDPNADETATLAVGVS
jgi:prepilin-type N-terminal cleavage/methylation domain-containing protein